ncbi:MAG TPA: hypothetical protein VGI22_19025 [Xanthobacteraceae bacterium]|jgi:hypothetical protein
MVLRPVSKVASAGSWLTTGFGCSVSTTAPVAGVAVEAAHRPAAFVVVVVAAKHEVDVVAVEQRQPGLADALVGAVALGRGGERVLVHLHHDPVDVAVGGGCPQGRLQPARLRAAAVAAEIERGAGRDRGMADAGRGHEWGRPGHEGAAVLVDHVVGVEREEERRADPEAVPAPREFGAVVRQRVAGEIGVETLRAVVELDLVIAQARQTSHKFNLDSARLFRKKSH